MDAAAGPSLTTERFRTLNELLLATVREYRERPALGNATSPARLSYSEVEQQAASTARTLTAWGVGAGDRVVLLSENRPEWPIVDYAVLSLGAVTVPIYPTLPATSVLEILEDCTPRVVVVADAARAGSLQASLPGQPANAAPVPWRLVTLAELAAASPAASPTEHASWRERALAVAEDDLATLIYTSGTTGRPKGVMLTHGNLTGMVAATGQHGSLLVTPGDVVLSVLPLAHVFERAAAYYFFSQGATTAYATSMQTVPQDIAAVRPHHLVAVPRLFEKVYNAVTGAPRLKGRIARWAARVAHAVARRETRGRALRPMLRVRRRLADRVVYRVLRQRMGGRIRTFICGGAPLERHIGGLFFAAGMPVYEGYGLTETSPVISANRPGGVRLGSAGLPYPGVSVRVAAEHEIQVRGPHVFRGYWQQPEATAATFTDDGWFRTGDIGSIDRDGFIFVVDRLKDLIVTAGGKNVAPGPLEQRVILSPFVAQAVLLGDRRPYLVMLVVPEFGALPEILPSPTIGSAPLLPPETLAADPRVQQHIASEVARLLADAPRVERPKRIALLTGEFSQADGLLTPTLKVRRRAVAARFEALLDQLYAQQAGIEVPWPSTEP